jgi:hypothetical protein
MKWLKNLEVAHGLGMLCLRALNLLVVWCLQAVADCGVAGACRRWRGADRF